MTKKSRSTIYNILFFVFIVFLFTPFGLPIRAKLTQGITYIKGQFVSPNTVENSNRKFLDTYNVNLGAISNANNIKLEDLKGKIIFINHWATWCPPCRAEMPSLNKLYQDYRNRIEFIFITNEEKSKVDAYYSKNNFQFPTYSIQSLLPEQITTSSIPATFILDKQGRVAIEEYGPADWNNIKVREVLDKLLLE